MPTASNIVDVDLRTTTGATPQDTYNDVLIVGSNPTTASPTYNEPSRYADAAEVATDFGSDSDVYAASEKVEEMHASRWSVVVLNSTSYTESGMNGSDTSAVSTATASNTPIRGNVDNISISLDGTAQTVIATAASPPTAPASGEAKINTKTGEIVTGDSSSGASTGIEATYEVLSWADAKPNLSPKGYDITQLADVRADESYLGDLSELNDFAAGHDAVTIGAYANGDDYASDDLAMEAAHRFGAALKSGSFLPMAHKSNDPLAAAMAGWLATKNAWHDPWLGGDWDPNVTTNYFREGLIGEPGLAGTFEGGDANNEGMANVLIEVNGSLMLSNSLTTAGEASDYRWFDVKRTEQFIESEMRDALVDLVTSHDRIPYDGSGRTLIADALNGKLAQYVSNGSGTKEGGSPLSDLEITVPRVRELPADAQENRRWPGIGVEGELASNAHEFGVELAIRV